MKKLLVFLVLLLSISVLNGCAKGILHVKVHKDGSADLQYDIGFSNTFFGFVSSDGKSPIAEIRKQAEDKGFTVTNYRENGYTGIRAIKHVNKLNDIFIQSGIKNSQDKKSLKIEKRFFTTRYILSTNVDMTNTAMEKNKEVAVFNNNLLNQMDMKLLIDLPIKPVTHNASNTRNNSQTLEWQLIPGDQNKIYMEAIVTNTINIVLSIVFVLIVFAGILFLLLKRRRENGSVTN